jgi:acetyl esterase/lipase
MGPQPSPLAKLENPSGCVLNFKFGESFVIQRFGRIVLFLALFALALCSTELALAQAGLEKATVAYRKVDGHEILADIYRPRDKTVRPVIVYIHGGALIMGNREWIRNWRLLSFAQQNGFAVVAIDYRLAPETKLPAIISDIESAFVWVGGDGAKEFHLDPDRMIVCGESAGGYLTLVTGYRVNPKPKALVVLFGYGELNADWYNKPNPYPGYTDKKITAEEAKRQSDGTAISDAKLRKGDGGTIYMYYRQNGLWAQEVSGFNPDSLATKIAPYEPVKNVTRDFPPTLLMHGTMDTDVPFDESLKMADQFKKHGVPYILLPIDKGEHALVGGDRAQIEDAYNTMQEFMLKYLGAK